MRPTFTQWMPRVGKNWLGKQTYDNPFPTWPGRPGFLDVLRGSYEMGTSPGLPSDFELDELLPVRKPDFSFNRQSSDNILLHWLGHATCLVEVGAVRLVTDPVFSYRCSPSQRFGPARYRPAPCQAEELPPVDICLISHAHYDHLDMPSLAAMARWHDCHFYVPLGLKDSMLRVTGRERVTEMNWWETVVHSGGEGEDGSVEVTALPAQHWSRRGVFDTNTTLWCGYAVECKQTMRRVCFVGDTGYCPAFKDVGEAFGPFDLSLIPIGAYEPNWFMKAQHVNPEEAYEIHKDLRSQRSLGIHHGTFRLTTEPVEEPKERFAKIRELNGSTETELFTLDAGGHVELHKQA